MKHGDWQKEFRKKFVATVGREHLREGVDVREFYPGIRWNEVEDFIKALLEAQQKNNKQ